MNIPAFTLVPATVNKIPNTVSRSSIEYKMWWDSPSSDTDWCNHPGTHHKLPGPGQNFPLVPLEEKPAVKPKKNLGLQKLPIDIKEGDCFSVRVGGGYT
jgi:hypothetical protein